jgi:hypothetical protein
MPAGNTNGLGLAEALGGVPAGAFSQMQGRVEALLDGRPDREGGGELVAVDRQVGAVAHADLVDLVEEVVGGVAGEHVGQTGLDTHADQAQQPAASNCSAMANWSSPSFTPGWRNGWSAWGADRLMAMSM